MTTLDTATHATPAPLRWREAVAAPFEGALRRAREWNDARVTRRLLSQLSTRQLDDIGLCRHDIAEAARRGL